MVTPIVNNIDAHTRVNYGCYYSYNHKKMYQVSNLTYRFFKFKLSASVADDLGNYEKKKKTLTFLSYLRPWELINISLKLFK